MAVEEGGMFKLRGLRAAFPGLAVLSLLLSGGCATPPVYFGDQYLPLINQIDTGRITMDQGVFKVSLNGDILSGEGDTLVLSDATTLQRFEMTDNTSVSTGEQIYEEDDTTGIDYLVVTLRRIGRKEGEVTRATKSGAPVAADTFFKVGGLSVQPLDAACSPGITLVTPITSTTDTSLELYKWISAADSASSVSRSSSGIDTIEGHWVFQSVTVTKNADDTASFTVTSFGQYAVVADVL